jgi:hypothetical protein
MKTTALKFSTIIESIFELPLEDRLEIKNLLEHTIAEERRNEMVLNHKKSQEEHSSGVLNFSSDISELKKMH